MPGQLGKDTGMLHVKMEDSHHSFFFSIKMHIKVYYLMGVFLERVYTW